MGQTSAEAEASSTRQSSQCSGAAPAPIRSSPARRRLCRGDDREGDGLGPQRRESRRRRCWNGPRGSDRPATASRPAWRLARSGLVQCVRRCSAARAAASVRNSEACRLARSASSPRISSRRRHTSRRSSTVGVGFGPASAWERRSAATCASLAAERCAARCPTRTASDHGPPSARRGRPAGVEALNDHLISVQQGSVATTP
jgi:hypothetical protein